MHRNRLMIKEKSKFVSASRRNQVAAATAPQNNRDTHSESGEGPLPRWVMKGSIGLSPRATIAKALAGQGFVPPSIEVTACAHCG